MSPNKGCIKESEIVSAAVQLIQVQNWDQIKGKSELESLHWPHHFKSASKLDSKKIQNWDHFTGEAESKVLHSLHHQSFPFSNLRQSLRPKFFQNWGQISEEVGERSSGERLTALISSIFSLFPFPVPIFPFGTSPNWNEMLKIDRIRVAFERNCICKVG